MNSIKKHEGLRLKPYLDSLNILSIGWGRNLRDNGISEDEAAYLLSNDIKAVIANVLRVLPWVNTLDAPRRDVIFEMAFNMGVNGLLTFRHTLRLIEQGQYGAAADAMLKSKWASQVGQRANHLSDQMRSGQYS